MASARPKKIKLASQTWKIVWVPEPWEDDAGDVVLGECCTIRMEIRVCTSRPLAAQKETLLHELIHAIFSTFGLTVPARGKAFDREEEVVSFLAEPMLMLMQQNPKLVAWLRT